MRDSPTLLPWLLSLQQRDKPPLRRKPKIRQQCLQQLNNWLGMEEPNRSISTKKDESRIRDRERHPSLIVLQTRSKPDPIRRWSAIVRDGSCFLRYEWKSGLDSWRGSRTKMSRISTGPIERTGLRSSIQKTSKKREATRRLKVFFLVSDRYCIVDSGASLHLMGRSPPTLEEQKTIRPADRTDTIQTPNGIVELQSGAKVYIKELDAQQVDGQMTSCARMKDDSSWIMYQRNTSY